MMGDVAQPPGTFRPIPDLQAEMERAAAARNRATPSTVIATGDVIQVTGQDGEVVTGRVLFVSHAPEYGFMVACEAVEVR